MKVRLLEALVQLLHITYGGVTSGELHRGWGGANPVSLEEQMGKCLFRLKGEGYALVHEYGEYYSR